MPGACSAREKSHLHASELQNIVVSQLACLGADGLAVDQRVITFFAAFDVHDEISFSPTRDRCHLYARSAERR